MALTDTPADERTIIERMASTVPDGTHGALVIDTFEITKEDALWATISHGFRAPRPGTYKRLCVDGTLWMSDTTAERRDHHEAVYQASQPHVRRVLVNGLGLGVVIEAMLTYPHIEQIDVVECHPDVIAYVGGYLSRDPRLVIHEADAMVQARSWPTGARWDVVWHDIWPTISEDNLDGMAFLNRSYGKRAGWQGAWCQAECRRQRRGWDGRW